MKGSDSVSRSPVGYLAAFTLGIICMGVIMFFTARQRIAPTADALPPDQAPQKIHFQRDSVSRTAPPRRSLPNRGVSRSSSFATALPENEEPLMEEGQENDVFEQRQSAPIVVNRNVGIAAEERHGKVGAEGSGQLSGRVSIEGPTPMEKVIPMDPECAAEHPGPVTTRFYVTSRDGGLADVLVLITAGLPQQNWPVQRKPVTLKLRGCLYENHIVGVQANQLFEVQNFGTVMHNVHLFSERNGETNRAFLPGQSPMEFKFVEPERFLKFKCDVHPWELAYVNVIEHPFFAITDANGSFVIKGLPPGAYTVQAHHRKAGVLQMEVKVENHRRSSVQFEFKATAPQALEI